MAIDPILAMGMTLFASKSSHVSMSNDVGLQIHLGIPWAPATIADVCFHASMCLDIRKKLGLRR